MKKILEEYLDANTDRFNCRWLCRRDPDLWQKILDATDFLPASALPKQRCWHVLNDVWAIPLCPIDNIQVSWFENRYLTYSSISAKARCPEQIKKKVEAYSVNSGHQGHWSSDPKVRKQIREKRAANSPRGFKRSDEWKAKIKATWDKKLGRDDDNSLALRKEYRKYHRKVKNITNRNYKYHRNHILNGHLPRSPDIHLDHIFSIFDGWKKGISPKVIAHPSNLRMISRAENSSKQHRSDKSLDDLYCDYLDNFTIG